MKRDLIIKNQFSVKRNGQGTKGNTPGAFVIRYMAREGATELVTPVTKRELDNFATRYHKRALLAESDLELGVVKHKIVNVQGLGGRSFGKGGNSMLSDASLSDQGIRSLSNLIQANFDAGKTVYESIVSFDGNYLKKHGLVDQDISLDAHGHALKKGAFRGKVDQLKLRMALMNGLDKMARQQTHGKSRFSDLVYVGVIQVDTKQVHCHLAMVDQGEGQLVHLRDGSTEQRGELNAADKRALRHGIDSALIDYEPIKMLSTSVLREKQDIKSYVRKYTEKAIQQSNFGQLILASLPDDKAKWRANSHATDMKQANVLVRFYAQQVLNQPRSGYKKTLQNIEKYAQARQEREGFSNEQYQALINRGQEGLLNTCMDSVYTLLKKIPDSEKNVHTRVLDGLAASIEQLEQQQHKKPRDPALEFTFHLKSYRSRLEKHRNLADQYENAEKDFKEKQALGQTNDAALAMFKFYQVEGQYQRNLATKYQIMLPLISRNQRWRKQYDLLLKQRQNLRNLRDLSNDLKISNLEINDLEQYGREQYNVQGARFLKTVPQVWQNRIDKNKRNYQSLYDDLSKSVILDNKHIEFDKNNKPVVKPGINANFNDVKALDLHEVIDDFDDTKISQNNIDIFVKAANARQEAYNGVVKYALATDQVDILSAIDSQDISKMVDFAARLEQNSNLSQNTNNDNGEVAVRKVVSADHDLTKDMQKEILTTLKQIDVAELENASTVESKQEL